MKIISAIFCLMFLVSCGKKPDDSVQPFKYSYNAYGAFTTKRAFLAHGNQGKGSDYLIQGSGLRAVFDGLITKEYQVVLFSYPKTKVDTFENAGMKYRLRYQAFLAWMIDDAETKFGVPNETLFGGVSLGGLHTFMAVALNPKITRYFALLPVTNITALKEFSHVNALNFNAFNEEAAVATKPGFILYDDADMRVNFHFDIQFISDIQGLGAVPQVEVRHGQGHTMTTATANILLNWI